MSRLWTVLLLLAAMPGLAPAQTTRVLAFSDVNYVASDLERLDGFFLGQVVAHAAADLGDRVAVFGEATATARPTGFGVEMERLVLRYEFADYLKLSAGRYHTPISYWNTAYHHGLWLQTSVARPQFVRFGSSFVPVHFVGLLAEGQFPAAPLGPGYFVGVGNGRHDPIARAGDAGDRNGHRAWLGGVSLRPARLYGLATGAAVSRDRVDDESGRPFDETILSAHVVWTKERPEFLGEYARVTHERADGVGEASTSDAYYAQVAYRLPAPLYRLKPYLRLERNAVPSGAPIYGRLDLDYEGAVAGLRYDFAELAALKVEYRNEQFAARERMHSLYVQVSFTFSGANVGAP